ncbi:hypothetical protein [[Kitasatospora] papulosa]|uniref:hypothetical protein n=1 Tax=[Kitasatospora] papulosa TaxID=1464011 RepID=UPI00403C8163
MAAQSVGHAVLVPPGVVLLLAVHLRGVGQLGVLVVLELHVTGDWRKVFTEGRSVSQMKIKHSDAKASGEYTVGKVSR